MAVEVISENLMLSDVTIHQARYAGIGQWELSCIPGRRFTTDQAKDVLRAAEDVATLLASMAAQVQGLGLTERELISFLTAADCRWDRPPADATPQLRDRLGRRWLARRGTA